MVGDVSAFERDLQDEVDALLRAERVPVLRLQVVLDLLHQHAVLRHVRRQNHVLDDVPEPTPFLARLQVVQQAVLRAQLLEERQVVVLQPATKTTQYNEESRHQKGASKAQKGDARARQKKKNAAFGFF